MSVQVCLTVLSGTLFWLYDEIAIILENIPDDVDEDPLFQYL